MSDNQTNTTRSSKGIFLFLALLMPIAVFLFLKYFGKNEFAVEPLFTTGDSIPEETCHRITYPYQVPDSVMWLYPVGNDSLLLLQLGAGDEESMKQMNRVKEQFSSFPVAILASTPSDYRKRCVFLMKDAYDLLLIDRQNRIRGQYVSSDREEVDRLITEVTIILKKY